MYAFYKHSYYASFISLPFYLFAWEDVLPSEPWESCFFMECKDSIYGESSAGGSGSLDVVDVKIFMPIDE